MRPWLAAAALVAVSSGTATAQTGNGTVTFGGTNNRDVPTVGFGVGPSLDFSSRILTGFGNTAVVAGGDARWWTSSYSGQGMVYGNSIRVSESRVLELRFEADAGFDLSLNGALFGGWPNTARNVSFQLFSDDYTQSTSLTTILTGTSTPFAANFGLTGWGNAIRLQFTETDASGDATGRGPYDVGIQDIDYTVSVPTQPPVGVPEPGMLVLFATGVTGLAMLTRRRRLNTA